MEPVPQCYAQLWHNYAGLPVACVYKAPCAPLSEIEKGAGLDTVDIIVVDVEGYDHEIIRQVDLAQWKPHTIIFEYTHIPLHDLEEVCDRLVEAGFHLDRDHEDILASRPMS